MRECHWFFVGDKPGQTDDEQGLAFIGKAGAIFDSYLDVLGLTSEEVYVTNVVKHRPPHNRDPKPDEIKACVGFLLEELRLVRPRLIVTLGKIATTVVAQEPVASTIRQLQAKIFSVEHPDKLLGEPHKRIIAHKELLLIRKVIDADKQDSIW